MVHNGLSRIPSRARGQSIRAGRPCLTKVIAKGQLDSFVCSWRKLGCHFRTLTQSVRHGLLLDVEVQVVGVEPVALVGVHFGSEVEKEARVATEEFGSDDPGVGGEAPEDVTALKVTMVQTVL